MAALPPPLNVNPVIKLARWTLLLWGIHSGSKRQRKLAKREVKIREAYLKKKKIRDEQLAIQNSISSAKDIAMLAALAEPPIDYTRYLSTPEAPKAAPPPQEHHEVIPPPVEAPPTKEDSHPKHADEHGEDAHDVEDFEVIEGNEEKNHEHEQEHEHVPDQEHKKPPCKPKKND